MRFGAFEAAVLIAAVVSVYLVLPDLRLVLAPPRGRACLPDDEGSWAVGLFRGPSPLNLTPIELDPALALKRRAAGLPPRNPILSCSSVTDAPSNFVADPFVLAPPASAVSGGATSPLFIFYETKSNPWMRGEIGAAASADGGATWRHAGIALREPWHLSYPHVFMWRGEAYMLPEGARSGTLRLYRAVQLPLRWELVSIIIDRPLVDPSMVQWKGRWYIFASDPSRPGYRNNADLSIFHAASPLGPWQPHALNPVMSGDPGAGARMAGRIVRHNGHLYRFGQDCRKTYGHRVVAFRIDALSPTRFAQTRVPLSFRSEGAPGSKRSWNSARHHHVDALQLADGSWLAVMDGDSQWSNPLTRPLVRTAAALGVAWAVAGAVLLARRLRARTQELRATEPVQLSAKW